MEKISFPRKIKVYLPLFFVFLILVFIMPKHLKFSYDYKKGSPWLYDDLVAQFDFPILKTESQILRENEKAWQSIIPYYKYDRYAIQNADRQLSLLDLSSFPSLKGEIASVLNNIYQKGIRSKDSSDSGHTSSLSEYVYIQKGRRAEKVPVSEIYTEDLARYTLKTAVADVVGTHVADSLFRLDAFKSLISPSLKFDEETTYLVHDEVVNNISYTDGVCNVGQLIVSNGEIVTSDICQLLDSYKAEYNKSVGYSGNMTYLWLASVLLSLGLVVVLFLAIYYCSGKIFEEYNKYLYLLMVFTLSALAASVVANHSMSFFFMVPFTLVALYLLAFFKKQLVFTVYVVSLLPILLFSVNGTELFVIYLVAGVVGMLVFGYFNKGWLQFLTAFIVYVVMVLMWLAFRLYEGVDSLSEYGIVFIMAFGALLSVACYPLIYLFEKIFKLVSNTKLVELSDTSNPLLRQLADKAPGTFQHSLQVMNLADAVARAIDANVLLVRAGALYHDIGKIANPQCFTENETSGVKYHSGLTPKESAQEIIKHVSDGLEMAEKKGLPSVICDFITTHHGTTCTGYFYNQYLNEGGSPDDVEEFFYNGVKPQTKEQVILMLCDAIEAASRSLKSYSPENISDLVDSMVSSKINDGQLDASEISLSEINSAKEVMKVYLQQIYHARIAYPKRKQSQAK